MSFCEAPLGIGLGSNLILVILVWKIVTGNFALKRQKRPEKKESCPVKTLLEGTLETWPGRY